MFQLSFCRPLFRVNRIIMQGNEIFAYVHTNRLVPVHCEFDINYAAISPESPLLLQPHFIW